MKTVNFVIGFVAVLALASAGDRGHLQDFCVAIPRPIDGVYINGDFCMDPKKVRPEHFFYENIFKPKEPTGPFGYAETHIGVDKIPGLNTLGLSLSRSDYAPNGGQKVPHLHPRASEFIVVVEGRIFAAFISSNNTLFYKFLNVGDVFVFPQGLVHFHYNIGDTRASTIGAMNSQNGGTVMLGNSVFGSDPPISAKALARAFQLDEATVRELQEKDWPIDAPYPGLIVEKLITLTSPSPTCPISPPLY